MKKVIYPALILLVVVLFFQRVTLKEFFLNLNKPALPAAVSYETAEKKFDNHSVVATTTSATIATTTPQITVPKVQSASLNLSVPFQAQAPFGNWVEPYKEGCEEAAIIMVDHYLRGVPLSKEEMNTEIDAQVDWQIKNWGLHTDLPVEKVHELAYAMYNYQTLVIPDLTIEKIKEQLYLGRPVIVPTAGRELHNPNYKQPGPIYHMLVIKGFIADGRFITNDPGTRNGADYIYSSSVLMAAIHDWTGTAPDGSRIGLVLYR